MNFERLGSNYGTEEFLDHKSKPENSEVEESVDLSRRSFLKKAAGAFVSGLGIAAILKEEEVVDEPARHREDPVAVKREVVIDEPAIRREIEHEEKKESVSKREVVSSAEFKKLRPDLSYEKITPELKIENLNLLGKESKFGVDSHEGKILRTLRFKNITDAIEDRYNLPSGVLMAMVMQESTGIDLLPNSSGDGGFGLCHMQGSTASDFNLKTFHECNSLVCNSVRGCKNEKGEFVNHAEQLKQLMKDKKDDRLALVDADDRLHFILNLDAAGRMLASYMSGPKLKGELSGINSFETAIARYAGKDNFRNYLKKVTKNMEDLKDSNVIDEIAENFNAINPDLKINGEPADFHTYITKFQEQHADYGLEEYKKLPKYNPKNSDEVLKTFS